MYTGPKLEDHNEFVSYVENIRTDVGLSLNPNLTLLYLEESLCDMVFETLIFISDTPYPCLHFPFLTGVSRRYLCMPDTHVHTDLSYQFFYLINLDSNG